MAAKSIRRDGGVHTTRSVPEIEDPGALPVVPSIVVDAVTELLMSEQGMRRPPEKAAALLALIVELYKRGLPFPKREVVAENLNCSKYTIDAALSTRIDEGYLTQAVETSTSHKISSRHGVVRHRYYIPSDELVSVVDRAKRRAGRNSVEMVQNVG